MPSSVCIAPRRETNQIVIQFSINKQFYLTSQVGTTRADDIYCSAQPKGLKRPYVISDHDYTYGLS